MTSSSLLGISFLSLCLLLQSFSIHYTKCSQSLKTTYFIHKFVLYCVPIVVFSTNKNNARFMLLCYGVSALSGAYLIYPFYMARIRFF